jgi:hypothetical protein
VKVVQRWAGYLALVAIAVGLLASSSAARSTAVGTPAPVSPRSGVRVQALPSFSWRGVSGADHYEFALAADAGFNSPVLGSAGRFTTKNTRATISQTVPNGTYWWHVRAISKTGAVGNWSGSRRVVETWNVAPRPLTPRNRSTVAYPSPLVLTWGSVPGASKYDVSLATDPALGSLVTNEPVETASTSLAPAVPLHVGTYYWAVTPVDAEGNKGARSPVQSFQWSWPSVATNLAVHDLVGPSDVTDPSFGSPFDTALYLPQFSWSPVPGATRYELEINSDQTWAAGSRVCCTDTILRNVFTPRQTFKSNRYYWRVRAFDARGNAGAWSPAGDGSAADSFVKTFDNVCNSGLPDNCVAQPGPSIRNLHVEDWSGANVTSQATGTPVVVWDPVPGAAAYDFQVLPYVAGRGCDFTHPVDQGTTATAGWTPLSRPGSGVQPPYPTDRSVATDSTLAHGSYCFRVRADADNDGAGKPVFGDFTELDNAFTYTGPSSGVVGGTALGGGDYLTPAQGQALRVMPVLRWRPVVGAHSYWVILSKDASFTNIVDYAFTEVPAYAPRFRDNPTTYPDETTTYYWVAIPAFGIPLGSNAFGNPVALQPGTFQKQVPPTNLTVSLDQPQPVFRWKPVPGALHYELEVSGDPNFGTTVETATTVSTSYTAAATYPAGKKLFWRVRADDVNKVGLSWATSSFQYRLPVPVPVGNVSSGTSVPTWRWRPVLGAVSYDVHVDLPNGSRRDFSGVGAAAFTPTVMTGTGIFHWQVRADFPGSARGPYSRPVSFARKIVAPRGTHTIGGGGSILLSWSPVAGATHYEVQISSKPDFSSTAESVRTDGTQYAPRLSFGYNQGGRFYWRVGALDAQGNTGDYSRTGSFNEPKHK